MINIVLHNLYDLVIKLVYLKIEIVSYPHQLKEKRKINRKSRCVHSAGAERKSAVYTSCIIYLGTDRLKNP